jgi:YVTN family beta-propeller protein
MILMSVSIVYAYGDAYIPNFGSNIFFVIDTETNQVTTSVNVGPWLYRVAITRMDQRYVFRTGTET